MNRSCPVGVAIFLAVLALSSCVASQEYRKAQSVYLYQYPSRAPGVPGAKATLCFIEFNDQGAMFDSGELDRALSTIRLRQKQEAQQIASASQGIVVVLFIHGWKNNASEDSGNVWGFRAELEDIASRAGRPVVGIYIGWRGASTNQALASNFTFGDRMAAAGRVGSSPALTNALYAIMRTTKGDDFKGASSCILVGHSFGGLILERALTQPLLDMLKQSEGELAGRGIVPPADLIVLLNEAAPGLQAKPLLDYMMEKKLVLVGDDGREHPLLLSITSTGDVATKFAFPGGRFFQLPGQKLQKYNPVDEFGLASEKPYFLLTAANTIALQSHEFVDQANKAKPGAPEWPPYLTVTVDGTTYDLDSIPKPTRSNITAYWLMQLPQLVVPDHSTVFRPELATLLGVFLEQRRLMAPAPTAAKPRVAAAAVNPMKVTLKPAP